MAPGPSTSSWGWPQVCAGLRLVVLSTVAGSVIAAALGLGALALHRWAQHAAQVSSAVVAP